MDCSAACCGVLCSLCCVSPSLCSCAVMRCAVWCCAVPCRARLSACLAYHCHISSVCSRLPPCLLWSVCLLFEAFGFPERFHDFCFVYIQHVSVCASNTSTYTTPQHTTHHTPPHPAPHPHIATPPPHRAHHTHTPHTHIHQTGDER